MKTNKELQTIIEQLPSNSNIPFTFDEEELLKAFNQQEDGHSLTTKVLTVFGAIVASLFFLGFLMLTNINDSPFGMLLVGSIIYVASIWISQTSDIIFLDSICVCAAMIGFALITIGLSMFKISDNLLYFSLLFVSILSLLFNRTYLLSFLSVIAIQGCIFALIINNKWFDAYYIQVGILALLLYYIFLKEAAIITKHKVLSILYNPVRTALIFCFIIGLLSIRLSTYDFTISYLNVLPSIVFIILILLQVPYITTLFEINKKGTKLKIYVTTLLILLTTAIYAPLSGSLLLLLLSFRVNHKTGLALAIISFISFIIQFYYDLDFTLFTKSILMITTGILFIGIFLFTNKKLKYHEGK